MTYPFLITAGGGAAESDWPEGLADLASMTLGATASGGQILHYHEDLARKTLEIDGLRRTKNRLESTLRDLQVRQFRLVKAGLGLIRSRLVKLH